jgi:C4-dicarboxylate-specific signal transduction histidine kinase
MWTHRLARLDDLPALRALMAAAIDELQAPYLTAEQIAASRTIMGLDTQLIADGTYFVVARGAGRSSSRASRWVHMAVESST